MRRRLTNPNGTRAIPVAWRDSFASKKTKAQPSHIRESNVRLILQLIYREGPISRADLARATGLTKVTVSDVISSLISENLVIELGLEVQTRPGKPAVLVDLPRKSLGIVCLDLSGGKTLTGVVLDLDFNELHRLTVSRDGKRGEEALAQTMSLLGALISAAEIPLVGITIGSPGVVTDDGVVKASMSLGWTDLPLKAIVEAETGLPATVENDANAATIAESSMDAEGEDLLFVSIWSGIGAGLLLSGQLLKGKTYASGEIGRLTVGPGDTTLEKWISFPELQKRLANSDDENETLTNAGEKLASALAPIVAMLNLNVVVLSGPPNITEGPFIESTASSLKAQMMNFSTASLRVIPSQHGEDVVLIGCAWLALGQFLENHNNK
jgi:Transcriptional regulator/sugar kinase